MSVCTLETKDGTSIIHIQGPAIIDTATELQRTFIAAARTDLPVIIDMEGMTTCDCTFGQLIVALCHTLGVTGKSLELLHHQVPEDFEAIIRSMGFGHTSHCTQTNGMGCCFRKYIKPTEIQE